MTTAAIENIEMSRDLVCADIVGDGVFPIDQHDSGGVYCYLCQEEHPFGQLKPLTTKSGVFTDKVRCDMDAAVWVCFGHIPFSMSPFEAFTAEVQVSLSAAQQKLFDREADDAMAAMSASEKEEGELKEKVLSEVRQLVSPAVFSAIQDYIAEEDFLTVSEFGIADSSRGDLQDLGYPFGSYYVWQESVGDSGDSFAGVISIPLPDGRFLQFSYSS